MAVVDIHIWWWVYVPEETAVVNSPPPPAPSTPPPTLIIMSGSLAVIHTFVLVIIVENIVRKCYILYNFTRGGFCQCGSGSSFTKLRCDFKLFKENTL